MKRLTTRNVKGFYKKSRRGKFLWVMFHQILFIFLKSLQVKLMEFSNPWLCRMISRRCRHSHCSCLCMCSHYPFPGIGRQSPWHRLLEFRIRRRWPRGRRWRLLGSSFLYKDRMRLMRNCGRRQAFIRSARWLVRHCSCSSVESVWFVFLKALCCFFGV